MELLRPPKWTQMDAAAEHCNGDLSSALKPEFLVLNVISDKFLFAALLGHSNRVR